MNEEKHNFPSEGSDERRTDEGFRGERTEEEMEKKPLTEEDPGLVGEGSDWETTAQEVRQQDTDREPSEQESAREGRTQGRGQGPPGQGEG